MINSAIQLFFLIVSLVLGNIFNLNKFFSSVLTWKFFLSWDTSIKTFTQITLILYIVSSVLKIICHFSTHFFTSWISCYILLSLISVFWTSLSTGEIIVFIHKYPWNCNWNMKSTKICQLVNYYRSIHGIMLSNI